MKGKNKFIIAIFAMLAMVAAGVGFAFKSKLTTIPYANAEEHAGYSAILDESVVFSAERVYIADDRTSELNYGSYGFASLKTSNSGGVEYFGNYGLQSSGTNYQNKDVIRDGDFVLVDDERRLQASDGSNEVLIKQGIMVTFGGYYFDDDGSIVTNTYGAADEGDDTKKYGAYIQYLSVQAKLNGEIINNVPNARSYSNAEYYDFTWFVEPSLATEGHYEIEVEYIHKGTIKYFEFDFYLLLKSQYDTEIEVVTDGKTNEYPTAPTVEYANQKTTSTSSYLRYDYFTGERTEYPTLTFDYTRYNLSYVYNSGDVQKNVTFNYNYDAESLELTTSLYNTNTTKTYSLKGFDNSIVTLMFIDNGEYQFDFKYIYNHNNTHTVIAEEQVDYPNIELDIYGYQLKYSKSGYASADMTYLEIVENNTMFILVNGFSDAKSENLGSTLGAQYKLIDIEDVEDGINYKTGTILPGVKVDEILTGTTRAGIISDEDNYLATLVTTQDTYPKTDRGLWFNLNDKYKLSDSYYYFNPTAPIDTALSSTIRKEFNKVTTFTTPGYYLIQVAYSYKNEADEEMSKYQYFAFQITSATPILNLYKTDAEGKDSSGEYPNETAFYAHEFTKQNVFANWKETEVFETTITGKLYYSVSTDLKNRYPSVDVLKAVADKKISGSSYIKEFTYEKNTLIKDKDGEGHSYLLVLEVENSATKTYTYFTIDKEKISDLKVYQVSAFTLDNKVVYQVKRNNLTPVTHTDKSVIDCNFAVGWAEKNSGASITASYIYTPFVKNSTPDVIESGTNRYVLNDYMLGERSNKISIAPSDINSILDVNKVITRQGIYEFELIDAAGNRLFYMVVLDRTEAHIIATYGDNKTVYTSGQMVSDYVDLTWGTHKAIKLGTVGSGTAIEKLLLGENIDNYYVNNESNIYAIQNLFPNSRVTLSENILAVRHKEIRIKVLGFENCEFIIKDETLQFKYNNVVDAQTRQKFVEIANRVVDFTQQSDLRIKVDTDENGESSLRYYTIGLIGLNKVTDTEQCDFNVRITPDKARGMVKSAAQDGESFTNEVYTAGKNTKYYTLLTEVDEPVEWGTNWTDYYVKNNKSQYIKLTGAKPSYEANKYYAFASLKNSKNAESDIYIENYSEGQASNDGVFVFEWAVPTSTDNFNVTNVKYTYYNLMDKAQLDNILKGKSPSEIEVGLKEHYYPYKYSETNYILKTESSVITTKLYEQHNDIYRSNAINLGYESYYEDGNLVTRKVTKSGLYIVTRTMEIPDEKNPENSMISEFSYVFFVDRNGIIEYSTSNITEKIVGHLIHASAPNSSSLTGVHYDNFTKQGIEPKLLDYKDDYSNVDISYKIYLETNKLPTTIQVPTGKYATAQYDTTTNELKNAVFTSYNNLKLGLTVYYVDSYNILQTYTGQTIKLVDKQYQSSDGYITLDFGGKYINEDVLEKFEQSRYFHDNDGFLTLPGTYIFVINDLVGKEIENNVVSDYNTFAFGIKITNTAPETDIYAYTEIDGETSDKTYLDNWVLNTNQSIVDIEIMAEDKNSFDAQVDIRSVQITRTDLNGVTEKWLTLTSAKDGGLAINRQESSVTGPLTYYVDTIKNASMQDEKYIIHLDTGLVLDDDGKIDSDKTKKYYEYKVTIQYVLANSDKGYYSYYNYANGEPVKEEFYQTIYTVIIDRTPERANLDEFMKSQGGYFTEYHKYLGEQNGMLVADNINQEFAYRSKTTLKDYYALGNDLFYQFVNANKYDEASKSMYAFTVDNTTQINTNNLSIVYYRLLDFDESIEGKTRSGLLPIVDTFFVNSSGFYTFHEASTYYSAKTGINLSNAKTYNALIKGNSANDIQGAYYEIIEKDLAGNYTQYVVYFNLTNQLDITFNINGKKINGNSASNTDTEINLTQPKEHQAFVGIQYVNELKNLASATYPYYAKIFVKDASGDVVKTVYTNSTSQHAEWNPSNNIYTIEGIESEIYNAIKEQGNYTIELTDVFGDTTSTLIGNYTGSDYELNTLNFNLKQDNSGEYYICASDVSSKVDNNVYWFATQVIISYKSGMDTNTAVFKTTGQTNGKIQLKFDTFNGSVVTGLAAGKLKLKEEKSDIIYLEEGDYKIIFVDITEDVDNAETVLLSTDKSKKDYRLEATGNIYMQSNIVYTASEITVYYNTNFYSAEIDVYVNDKTDYELIANKDDNDFYKKNSNIVDDYESITLKPDYSTDNPMEYGSLRRFSIKLKTTGEESNPRTIEIWIDTRTTEFKITNTNLTDLKKFVNVELKNTDNDYEISKLSNSDNYNKVIAETINITWTKTNTEYFTYNYQLYEFTSEDVYKQLLTSAQDKYTIKPSDENTGRYVFKVTIHDRDGNWIASKVYFIYMSTTMTGLYKVTANSNEQSYSSKTNIKDIEATFGKDNAEMAKALGFVDSYGDGDVAKMNDKFLSYGNLTAIPMYISINNLIMEVNKDNGVDCRGYTDITTSGATITLYYIWRANYYTFAVTMTVPEIKGAQSILSTFEVHTGDLVHPMLGVGAGTSKVIYDKDAQYYKLIFNSYSISSNNTLTELEKHNKIVIDVEYNNMQAKQVVGGNESTSEIEFRNAGSYTLHIKDFAGNVQKFKASNSASELSKFTVVVMKEMLYTINNSAPVEFAYYSSDVILQVDLFNSATGRNNYDVNSLTLSAFRNGKPYSGYTHPTGSTKYTFTQYGTYMITIGANLLGTGQRVTSYLVFTILNPDEARTAIDFTSISGYNIVKITDISKSVHKDVTQKFLELIQDKANTGSVTYNKLVTYERLAEAFGGTVNGKIKIKVNYEADNDDLLPPREIEFMFTLNNEKATINSSIEAGEKTTKTVTLKLNAANIYDQIGDCYLMINDSVALVINKDSRNSVTEIKISEVGEHYVRLVGDSGNVAYSFSFTIKEPLNVVAIILIVIVAAIVLGFVGTFIWLRTRMKVR